MNEKIEKTIEKHPLIEYFDKTQEMGITPRLTKFGKGYRLEVGNLHIYFENKEMTYTGWGMKLQQEKDKNERE